MMVTEKQIMLCFVLIKEGRKQIEIRYTGYLRKKMQLSGGCATIFIRNETTNFSEILEEKRIV